MPVAIRSTNVMLKCRIQSIIETSLIIARMQANQQNTNACLEKGVQEPKKSSLSHPMDRWLDQSAKAEPWNGLIHMRKDHTHLPYRRPDDAKTWSQAANPSSSGSTLKS
ncbi:hypothetical protein CGCA056_v003742 [Colletotrichum aenigma]|uniref:uncharacterized protein n=1 Tax=Colletotrichum aenigma TaxID=1215731 RepID=UPI0018729114|nr:uncharacterized protein CGCA056_v003742 [Colletotrichum aenigma]KAF5525683.1 hypothetical protein CGCA056_v003742 [Colletotrichum aenigma]